MTNKLTKAEKAFLSRLGDKVRKKILEDGGYNSLDAFSLEYHDKIAKPTLYQICEGKRDMKLSTLLRLADSLDMTIQELLEKI